MKDTLFNIGAQVHCLDGRCGKMTRVVVEPESLTVNGFVVEEGVLLKRARFFPVSTMDYAGMEDIHLSLTKGELSNYPEYREDEVELPAQQQTKPAGYPQFSTQPMTLGGGPFHNDLVLVREKVRIGVPPEYVVLGRDTAISTGTETIGTLEQVLADSDTFAITGLGFRQGTIITQDVKIPIAHVQRIKEDGIVITNLEERLRNMMHKDNDDHDDHDDHDYHEYYEDREFQVEPGNQPLSNETALVSTIAERLASDPETSDAVIEVINDRGVITLSGVVKDMATKEAAEEIAYQAPNVVSVVNSLQVNRERATA